MKTTQFKRRQERQEKETRKSLVEEGVQDVEGVERSRGGGSGWDAERCLGPLRLGLREWQLGPHSRPLKSFKQE